LILLAFLDPTSFVSSWGYLAIFLLSVLQSCCVPTSSELTLGFGGVLAAQGKLSLGGVIAAGVAGEVVGAYIAWFIGRTGGRGFVDRYGRYVLLTHRDLDRAEAWYQRHGRWGVFGSRLLPVVRNFVALPAGVAEVPLVRFGLLTFAGSLIWDTGMALIGYQLGSRWQSVMHGFSDAGYLLIGLVVLAVALFLVHRYRSYKAATALQGPGRTSSRAGGHFAGGRAESVPEGRPPAGGRSATPAPVPPDLAEPGAVGLVEGQGRTD
jgi:membrane protein DedA with SNARE-associated domain